MLDTNLEVRLKEYEFQRKEAQDTIIYRNQIVSYGLATIGIIIAGLFSALGSNGSGWILSAVMYCLCYGIPFISCLFLLVWLGELERMVRAGKSLVEIESKINTKTKEDILIWHTIWKDRKFQLRYPYFAVILLFQGIAILMPVVGYLVKPFNYISLNFAVPWVFAIAVGIFIFSRLLTFKEPLIREIKKDQGKVKNE